MVRFLWYFVRLLFVCRSRIDFIRLRFSIACRTCLMRNLYNWLDRFLMYFARLRFALSISYRLRWSSLLNRLSNLSYEKPINLIGSSCTSLVFASLCRSRIDFIRLHFSIACRTCLVRNYWDKVFVPHSLLSSSSLTWAGPTAHGKTPSSRGLPPTRFIDWKKKFWFFSC